MLSVLDSQDDPERQRRQLEAFIRSSRGGLLWVPAHDTPQETFDLLRNHRIPTVTFLRRESATDFDHVGILNVDATKTATNYLADLGHRHIAFLGGVADVEVRNQRIAGYKAVLAERNLGPAIIWESPDDKPSGLNAMTALREAHPEVSGVVCNGDMVALGACLALARMGQTPGEDVSVIGFDDIQDAAVATPPLTTMAVSPYRLGRRLARVLLERIREPETPVAVSEISAELIVRETSGSCVDSTN
ncbi:Purine nucleotide synthesis repressor [Cognatishimia activa]|uniref:Purine nucleotide synthesis repressor n=1 Tax=Cognatishimia activa TaxID=1715691 RepID=A0A0P1IML1_9RHOB|nr:Purine nucleotide synthesis repressor [Cognatishimia activa]CUK24777.1 Purine nucleotide synthesis repressor [Cognatishimia activa]